MTDSVRTAVLDRVGATAVSDWIEVTQAMIDQFAETTADHQFIHVDPVAAAATPFGGTIAHGFLTLSLFSTMAAHAPGVFPALPFMGVNYGANRVRFLAPVPSGARVRGHFKVLEVVERSPGLFQQTTEFSVEIEGRDKPALAAEWIIQMHVGADPSGA